MGNEASLPRTRLRIAVTEGLKSVPAVASGMSYNVPATPIVAVFYAQLVLPYAMQVIPGSLFKGCDTGRMVILSVS